MDLRTTIVKTLLGEQVENFSESFFGDMKKNFVTGMVDKIKKSIPSEHHKHYDFDSVKTHADAKDMISKAKHNGHI